MPDLPIGLYERIVDNLLHDALERLDASTLQSKISNLDAATAPVALAEYLKRLIARKLHRLHGERALDAQIKLCNRLLAVICEDEEDFPTALDHAQELHEICSRSSIIDHHSSRPNTPLSLAGLFTGSCLDPTLASQLAKEMESADQVDILCSFIKWSGIRTMETALRKFTKKPNARLRVLTTCYMGATDVKAVEMLAGLPNTELRVSYDTLRTRLHAKAYLIHRATGFGSAYVGSSNLSNAALIDGLEWNVKISQYEQTYLWDRIEATFETYWAGHEFEPYGTSDRTRLEKALNAERSVPDSERMTFYDLQPYGFQQEILDHLAAEREINGRTRQLVVAATGTGKTMIAAFDYRNWSRTQKAEKGTRPTLLYVAHREEILRQSLDSFRAVLRDLNFGDLLVGNHQPDQVNHLFTSIQMATSRELWNENVNYDYVVIDEFHHAAAPTYKALLDRLKPKVLLGLTATPERADGLDVTGYFDGHFSAEIRLPDAINRKLLCPFQYFGISDNVDLSTVRWERGGYRESDLRDLYDSNVERAGLVVDRVNDRLLDAQEARGLGFCVSVEHAQFMAEQFNRSGINAACLSAESPGDVRSSIQQQLVSRQINFLFVVDLYNEGVDIREVDTVLLLRPTQSLTVFLQQLGRGLRHSENKDCLTVLDFIGQANPHYRYDIRYRALTGSHDMDMKSQVEQGFPYLPAGCTIDLESKARKMVLDNIAASINVARGKGLIEALRQFTEQTGKPITLSNFLNEYDFELDDIYRRQRSWTRLQMEAGLLGRCNEPDEEKLTKGLRRVEHINSPVLIRTILKLLYGREENLELSAAEDARLLMFSISLWGRKERPANAHECLEKLRQNPVHCEELIQVLHLRLDAIEMAPPPLDLPFECPLELHGAYTRDEILAGLGHWTWEQDKEMREGCLYLKSKRCDVFLTTLDKSEKEYSPTTMYEDYAIDDRFFHWQSQSTTSEQSETGRRYIHQEEIGHTILLFVRERSSTTSGISAPFDFLGSARYVRHTGSRPMSIVWQLTVPMPARLVRRTARLVVN